DVRSFDSWGSPSDAFQLLFDSQSIFGLGLAALFAMHHPALRVPETLTDPVPEIKQRACATAPNPQACFSAGLPVVLTTIAGNVETILFAVRATDFHGVLMVVNYYSLDFSDPAGTAVTVLLNQAITRFAHANGA